MAVRWAFIMANHSGQVYGNCFYIRYYGTDLLEYRCSKDCRLRMMNLNIITFLKKRLRVITIGPVKTRIA